MKVRFIFFLLLNFMLLEARADLVANPQKKSVQLTGQHVDDLVTALNRAGRKIKSFNIYLFCDSDQLANQEECLYVESKLGEDISPYAIRGMLQRSDKNVKALSDSVGIRVKYHLGVLARQLRFQLIQELQIECRVRGSEKNCTLTHIR